MPPLPPYPDVSGVVHVNRHDGGVEALHAADGDALGFVLVLVSGFPEGLRGAVREAADHGGPTGRLDVHHAGQVLQTGHQAEVLSSHTVRLVHVNATVRSCVGQQEIDLREASGPFLAWLIAS